ncbi:hypothetical protein GCM10010305_17810 [Streptomyces termitum]|uniref:Uncharacterized protein n=1 Tax=Streptomyces termitum TaxID=67368 RepID=A0A918SX44_9ACTN|nr:hypothetical protein GCM10010305_17810 [Streptomyces termitum]
MTRREPGHECGLLCAGPGLVADRDAGRGRRPSLAGALTRARAIVSGARTAVQDTARRQRPVTRLRSAPTPGAACPNAGTPRLAPH